MPNQFQHKRSTTTAVPPSLNFGELAFTTNGNILYIGNTTSLPIAVGAQRFPGVLTANGALVTDANNWIDQSKTAKIVLGPNGTATENVTSISYFANSTQLGAVSTGSNNEIVTSFAVKSYVDAKAGGGGLPQGANTQIQFNNSGAFGADADFTWDNVNNIMSLGNSTVNTVINTSSIRVSNIIGTSMGVAVNTTFTAAAVNYSGANLNIASTNTNISSIGTTFSGTTVTISANTNHTGANNTIAGTNTAITSTGFNVLGTTSATSANATFTGANTVISSANTNLAGTVTSVTGATLSSSANVSFNGANTVIAGTNTTVSSTGFNVTGVGNFSANVTIAGNLVVTGTTSSINVATVTVKDSIIRLADNNLNTDIIDSGFYGVYGNSTVSQYSGLYRDASNAAIWTVFNTQLEPTSTVDTANNTYTRGKILADFATEVFTANSTKVSISAGAMLTALSVADGGTGATSFTSKGILYGNGTGAILVTAAGTDGQVLQSNSTGFPIYSTLDGGSF